MIADTRSLARLVQIKEILAHKNADAIELALVEGWQVVARRGEFQAGDYAIYFEIDSMIPREIAPFLFQPHEKQDSKRLRTANFRGELSQGLLLPYDQFQHVIPDDAYPGFDLTDILGIQKYEPQIPTCLSGDVVGFMPEFIRKTDQIRVQSLPFDESLIMNTPWRVEYKLDGTSMTVFWNSGEFGVCGRNYQFKLDQIGNSLVDEAKKLKLQQILGVLGQNIAIQGELCGPGIQDNRLKLPAKDFFVFDIWDIDTQSYLSGADRDALINEINDIARGIDSSGLLSVNVFAYNFVPKNRGVRNIHELVEFVDEKCSDGILSEGFVFKSQNGQQSFKSINNRYLMKHKL